MKDYQIVFVGLSIIPIIMTTIMIFTNTILSGIYFAILLWTVPIGLTIFAYFGERKTFDNRIQKESTK